MSIIKAAQGADNLDGASLLMLTLRTAVLFGGIALLIIGIRWLWEIRPIFKRRYSRIVSAKVIEIIEEHRSATLNVYITPRFEFINDEGKREEFMPPKAVHPCRLKFEDEVKLCITPDRKFRAIRSRIKFKTSLIFAAAGLLLIATQIF